MCICVILSAINPAIVCVYVFCLVFFFKQKTAYEMRISDWSSDVCSSDLHKAGLPADQVGQGINVKFWGGGSQFSILTIYQNRQNGSIGVEHSLAPLYYLPDLIKPDEIGRA